MAGSEAMRRISTTWFGSRSAAVLAAAVVAMCVGGAWLSTAVAGDAGTTGAAFDDSVRMWVRYPPLPTRLSPQAELGRQLFFDTALSASKRMSCASCHSPAHAYGPPN